MVQDNTLEQDYKNLLSRLKQIQKHAIDTWLNSDEFKAAREVLGRDAKHVEIVKKAVLKQDFSEIKEFSDEFYKVYEVASKFQDLIRNKVYSEFKKSQDFDALLVAYSAKIASLYDKYFVAWAKAMQNSPAAKLLKLVKEKYPALLDAYKNTHMYNQYAVNVLDLTTDSALEEILKALDSGNLTQEQAKLFLEKVKFVPYSEYFKKELAPILEVFEEAVNVLSHVANSKEQQNIVAYLNQYRKALAETDLEKLDATWKELDIAWLKFNYKIEIVHDIEYDYGDPLRTKIIPDFSVRFLDPDFAEYNEQIKKVKSRLADYFKRYAHERLSNYGQQLLKEGLLALEHSSAGLYYLPFLSAMSLYFKFSGQSIPNRQDVKAKYGVKIYFDPYATKAREEQVVELANKVVAKRVTSQDVDAVESIVYHVAAHEFGHAIFGLRNLRSLSPKLAGLMEEWRAERVALTMMLELYRQGDISEQDLERALYSFALYDLRRFANFESKTLRPYIISAIDTYNIYEQIGYVRLENEKLVFDKSKTKQVLEIFEQDLIKMLNAISANAPEVVDDLHKKASNTGKLVKWLVGRLGKN